MLKAIYLKGQITAPLANDAAAMQVDRQSADILRQKLKAGDWTYVAINDGIAYEVVRIVGVVGTVVAIERGVDGTTPGGFGAPTGFQYIIPQQAITDVVDAVLTEGVEFTGSGAAKVTQTGPFAWNVHVPKLSIISKDPSIEVADLYPTFFVYKK